MGFLSGPALGGAAKTASVDTEQERAPTDAEAGPRRRRLRQRTAWLLLLMLLVLGLALASFLTRQPRRLVTLFLPPDRMATAQVVEPPLIRAAVSRSYDTWIQSLACACDAGNGAVVTGSVLDRSLRTIRQLHRDVQRWAVTPQSWHVDWTRLQSPTTAQLQVSIADTRELYQGLVPIKRIDGAVQTRYRLTRFAGGWKITQARKTRSVRHTTVFSGGPRLSAQAAFILDDKTGHTLYAYNPDTPRFVGSTAKMLTAIVALQHLRLGATVAVPADAMVDGTSANLVPGERMLVRDMFYGMLLPSGNDAAVTLADASAGSVPAFATLMNAEARRLHLRHSHFVVPHGLDYPGQYSTARDLARMAHALLRRPFLASVVRTRFYHATSIDKVYAHDWTNLNHLLGSYPGAIGVKTGTTPAAGANLVACAVRDHRRIIAVVVGDTAAGRYSDAVTLLDYGWRLLGFSAGRGAPAHL